MSERWIAFRPWVVPYVRRNFVRIFEGRRDVTEEWFPIDHIRNRAICKQANEHNAAQAVRFGISRGRPYYHYDAIAGRAIELTIPPNDDPQDEVA